jgi:divalent metal cation (Fe/Co/Zn/Cd) transporter
MFIPIPKKTPDSMAGETDQLDGVAKSSMAPGEHNLRLLRRGLLLEYTTLAWNVVGTIIVVVAAIEARSVALAGFGLDSLIEIFASTIVVWQIRGVDLNRERPALRLIGGVFFLLAVYVLVQAAYTLSSGIHPAPSWPGIIWLILTVIAMLLLAWGKLLTGRQLGNPVISAEARVTLIDGYLAATVLVGLILNALFDWWWADPLASLVLVYYGIKEGIEARRHAAEL